VSFFGLSGPETGGFPGQADFSKEFVQAGDGFLEFLSPGAGLPGKIMPSHCGKSETPGVEKQVKE